MHIHVTVHHERNDQAILHAIGELLLAVRTIGRNQDILQDRISLVITKQEEIMATLDETLEAVTETRGKAASIVTLLTGIKAQLDAALGGALTPALQAKVDAIFAEAKGASGDIQTGIDANDDDPNTPAPPAPTP